MAISGSSDGSTSTSFSASAADSRDQTIAELKAQLEALSAKVAELEERIAQTKLTKEARDKATAELKKLRRENAELRRANAILKTASAFFAAELDRPHH